MIKKFLNLVMGDLDKKKEYRILMNQVNQLPKDYQNTYKQIMKYYDTVGGVSELSEALQLKSDLLELFINGVETNQSVEKVIGLDIAQFANDFLSSYSSEIAKRREKLNNDIKVGLEQL